MARLRYPVKTACSSTGGAMLPSGGVVRLSVLPEALQGEVSPQRSIRRCSMSKAWVVEPGRISTAELMGEVLV